MKLIIILTKQTVDSIVLAEINIVWTMERLHYERMLQGKLSKEQAGH
jgi:hypothetical protein